MQFGVREICDVVFKAKTSGKLGSMEYEAGEPVLYIDTAKTSTMEGSATTVYATGGSGNSRLISWEGEKTLTFTVEDALLSEIGFAVLSGAGLMDATSAKPIFTHVTTKAVSDANGVIDLSDALEPEESIASKCPVFVKPLVKGSLGANKLTGYTVGPEEDVKGADGTTIITYAGTKLTPTFADDATDETKKAYYNAEVLVDFYVERTSAATELTIDAENFAGYYYVEASTLFRRQSDGKDLPAELVFPNVKIQSNFTFSMAATGDPSTFTFTMDAMPGYTRFDRSKKVLCVMQIVDPAAGGNNKGTDSVTNPADEDKKYPLVEE